MSSATERTPQSKSARARGREREKNAQRVKWNANRKEKQIENNVIQYAEYLRFTRLCEWIFSYFPISHETMTITLAESPICWTLTANFNVQSFISHNSPVLLFFVCLCVFFFLFVANLFIKATYLHLIKSKSEIIIITIKYQINCEKSRNSQIGPLLCAAEL